MFRVFVFREATDALDGFGQMYLEQTLASGVILRFVRYLEIAGGGMAISSAIADFVFMAEDGKLFCEFPMPWLEMTAWSKCDTASAKFQSEEAGLVDMVGSEDEILGQIKDSYINSSG